MNKTYVTYVKCRSMSVSINLKNQANNLSHPNFMTLCSEWGYDADVLLLSSYVQMHKNACWEWGVHCSKFIKGKTVKIVVGNCGHNLNRNFSKSLNKFCRVMRTFAMKNKRANAFNKLFCYQ